VDGRDIPPSTEKLCLQGNLLTCLPENIRWLSQLRHVLLGTNHLTNISPVFSCPNLVHLSACFNQLESLRPRPCPVRAYTCLTTASFLDIEPLGSTLFVKAETS
jgi:Leucine-rich repeat (LRR) protein